MKIVKNRPFFDPKQVPSMSSFIKVAKNHCFLLFFTKIDVLR